MTENNGLNCFVIMPYGEKTDTDGKVINFDVIYRYVIRAAVNEFSESDGVPINVVRCDDIEETGSIRTDMFDAILKADIAIVDITTENPNVFYELGIRHALNECITILIRRKVSRLPFNIQGLRAIDYDPADVESFDAAKIEIQNYIRNALRTKKLDSPVREVLPDLVVSYALKPLRSGLVHRFTVVGVKPQKSVCLVTGDLRQLRGVADAWVNSENTHMQMARYHDRSVSGLIRYLGARQDKGQVTDDLIGDALTGALDWKGEVRTVQPGAVIATHSGALADSHRVRRIYHVASVRGIPGGGYEPVPNTQDCVWNVLSEIDKENDASHNAGHKKDALRSVLFPVFGSGTARGRFKDQVNMMVRAAVDFFDHNEMALETVYFLAHDRSQLTDGLDVMAALVREHRLKPAPKGGGRKSSAVS